MGCIKLLMLTQFIENFRQSLHEEEKQIKKKLTAYGNCLLYNLKLYACKYSKKTNESMKFYLSFCRE